MLKQTHSDDVHKIEGGRGYAGEGDALVTDRPGVLIGVRTADCVPILMVDAEHLAVAAVHAGWRGTSANIVRKAIARMSAEYGSRSCATARGHRTGDWRVLLRGRTRGDREGPRVGLPGSPRAARRTSISRKLTGCNCWLPAYLLRTSISELPVQNAVRPSYTPTAAMAPRRAE